MDSVFKEEQEKLEEIEEKIDFAAKASRKSVSGLKKNITGFHPLDYEDVDRRREMLADYRWENKKYEELMECKPSPYFGRIDLDSETAEEYESNSFYIGKKGLTIGSDVVIVDWRAPIGECYYAQNQTTFGIKGITYNLALRRALDIQNAKLISYKTEYDGNNISLEGDVIDPFLLTVLRDKRRQNRLTDIIRSIQENQNTIIRCPRTESFIVQGCAGSGKTMILLHRLSYLKFNNRKMALSGVKIITPNSDFNAHINELSYELDIDTISKFTVEEYYVDLINRYSNYLNANSIVSSETSLPVGLLEEIYSIGFMEHLREQYNVYWDTVLGSINEERLRESYLIHKIKYPVTQVHTASTAAVLADGINNIVNEYKERKKKYDDAQKRKTDLEAEYHQIDDLCRKVDEEAIRLQKDMEEKSRQN